MRYLLTILLTILYLYLPAQQSTFLRATTATSGGGGTTGILDSYTGAATAYATSLLYGTYSGSCLRVRRDSDNAEQDIGFSGQDIDEAAINSFCSGANCYVTDWYDQSGAGNNATQATAGNQPKIYDSSTGIIYNNAGNVAIHFVDNSSTALNSDYLTFSVFHAANVSNLFFWSIQEYGGGVQYFPLLFVSTTNMAVSGFFSSQINRVITNRTGGQTVLNNPPSMTVGLTYLATGYANRITIGSAINAGAYITTTDSNTDFVGGGFYTMGGNTGGGSTDIFLSLLVFYDSDQSTNRAGIETAINTYFTIYP